jgi:hypothetical protein
VREELGDSGNGKSSVMLAKYLKGQYEQKWDTEMNIAEFFHITYPQYNLVFSSFNVIWVFMAQEYTQSNR